MKFRLPSFNPTLSSEKMILIAALMIIVGIAIPIILLLLLLLSDCPLCGWNYL
ncbi:hypothetical protein [Trabulsiella odontotermitis]|uniref:hypothetical protein n=1 Tax=Trabulsiella odontotermitis TaxID=379893 RepID=UPI000A97040E|nr:hypothetical protein [Trabulsiella odontotermitis]